MWQQIKSGAWLTAERLRAYALILLALTVVIVGIWIALSDGLLDRKGKPLGTDFSNVWAAGRLVLEGEPAAPYDPPQQYAAEKRTFGGREVPFYGWHYPPLFLLVAAGLALLPYGFALAAWMAITLPAYLGVIRAIVPRPQTLLLAAAFPAVLVNLGHGQNGFLTAALIGGALLFLDERPAVAGVLFGLMAYKPQFGPMIPLVLLATGRWRVIAAATVTALAAAALTLALLGAPAWLAFAQSTTFTRVVAIEEIGWPKIQSLYSAMRMWGAGVDAAYAAQGALTLTVAASLVWLWRRPLPDALKAAALPCACLLTTPYVLDYDLVVLAVAIAFYVRFGLANGFRDYEISILAFAYVAPLLTRSIAGAVSVPLGLMSTLMLYALTLWRADLGIVQASPRPAATPFAPPA